MEFHYRERDHGECEVICTSCFQVVGMARDADTMLHIQQRHQCSKIREDKELATESPVSRPKTRDLRLLPFAAALTRANKTLAVLVAICVLYLLPTICEFAARRFANTDLSLIAMGDLAGCLSLAFAFGKTRLGVILYISLAAGKATAMAFGIVSADSLIWISDAVPTTIAAALLQKIFYRERLSLHEEN